MEEFQKTNPLARGDETIKPIDIYAEHAKIREQVFNEINKLHKTLDSNRIYIYRTTIEKFLDCITPLKNLHDPGRLPKYATTPRSIIRGKVSCVWAVVSCLVQAYWKYELGSDNDDGKRENKLMLDRYLSQLRAINGYYSRMKVAGTENTGYWLKL